MTPDAAHQHLRAEQARLCRLAREGDRDAADRLARSVVRLCRKHARRYARLNRVDPDELESVGLARFPACVQTYDESQGGFVTYFATAACRAMMRACRRHLGRRESPGPRADEAAAVPDRGGTSAAVHAALAALDPLGRAVLEAVEGYGGKRVPVARVARDLGVSPARVEAIHRAAFNRLSDLLLSAA